MDPGRVQRISALILTASLLTSCSAAATTLRVGIQGGVNLSRADYELVGIIASDDATNRYRTGAAGGIVLWVIPSGATAISWDTGILVESRGGDTELPVVTEFPPGETFDVTVEWRITCLTIPAAVRMCLGSSDFRPYAKLGGEVVVPLSGEVREPSVLTGSTTDTVTDIQDDLTTTLGLLGALGVEFPLSGVTGTAEVSYRHGLGDAFDRAGADADAQLRHRVVGFRVGVLF